MNLLMVLEAACVVCVSPGRGMLLTSVTIVLGLELHTDTCTQTNQLSTKIYVLYSNKEQVKHSTVT